MRVRARRLAPRSDSIGRISVILLLLMPLAAPILASEDESAPEDEEEFLQQDADFPDLVKEDDGALADELAHEDADFPDLVRKDETGEIIDEFAFLQEENLVFSAAKHQQEVGFSPSAVIVITRKQIQESGAATFMELLRRYPVFEAYEVDPAYPTARIRTNYRVLMLLDGRETNLEVFPPPWYSLLPVGLTDIERIEIVIGPNSALYGANAVSAVVNVMTRPPSRELKTEFSVFAGEYGTSLVEGVVGAGLGPFSAKVALGLDQADSWMDRNLPSRNVQRINSTMRLQLPGIDTRLSAGLVHGSGRLFTLVGYMDTDHIYMGHVMLDVEAGDFKFKAYWYKLQTSFVLELGMVYTDLNLELGSIPAFELFGDTLQAQAQYDLEPFEDNLLIAGADVRYTLFSSDQLVDPEITEVRAGVFLHDEHRFSEYLLLTLGARFDWNSRTQMALSPRAVLSIRPAPEHFIRLSAGSAFRKPTLLETSANFKVDTTFPEIRRLFEVEGISNPDLDNELLATLEIGYRGSWFDRALRLQSDFFMAFNRSYIGFDTQVPIEMVSGLPKINVEESRLGYQNLSDDTNVIGLYVSLEGSPLPELNLFLRVEYQHGWQVEKPDDITGETISLRFPKFLLTSGLTARPSFGLLMNLALIYVSSVDDSSRDPDSILSPTIEMRLPARYFLLASCYYPLDLGGRTLDLGFSFFNPFGSRFREKAGLFARDGSNFGGELLDSRALLFARLHY